MVASSAISLTAPRGTVLPEYLPALVGLFTLLRRPEPFFTFLSLLAVLSASSNAAPVSNTFSSPGEGDD
ncbi:MAG TPA: hypothetical protein PK926_10550 [Spirochaetota bacterium]|nr:hypothetical protein [Spirochaetota bacterium]HPI89879.1 hypothetical protein [Spirochaetota bacterium]HPR47812.1 hypothetical protein [Spirochaetota bacterium]